MALLPEFLSTPPEIHAFVFGISHGSRSKNLAPTEYPDNPDVRKEPHYYAGGYIFGTFLQLGIITLLAYTSLQFA